MKVFTFFLVFIFVSFVHYKVFTLTKPVKVFELKKYSPKKFSIKMAVLKKETINKVKQEIKKEEKIKEKKRLIPKKKKVKKKIKKKKRLKKDKKIKRKIIKKDKKQKKMEELKKIDKLKDTLKTKKVQKSISVSNKSQTQSLQKFKKFKENYLSLLREHIDNNKKYPAVSKRLGEEGVVVLSFKILKSGVFENIRIVTSSGKKRLDKAALNVLRKTGHFKAFPKNIKKNFMNITVPIQYKLE